MGKKKNKYRDEYDNRPAVDFSNPEEVRKYFSELTGDTSDDAQQDSVEPTTYVSRRKRDRDTVAIDNCYTSKDDTVTYRGIAAMAAQDTEPHRHDNRPKTPQQPSQQDVPQPPRNQKPDRGDQGKKWNTNPDMIVKKYDMKAEPVAPTQVKTNDPSFNVSFTQHPYGDRGNGMRVKYCNVLGEFRLSTMSITVPLYDNLNADLGSYFDETDPTEEFPQESFHRVIADIGLLFIVRGLPDAVYPYEPQGLNDISEVLHESDLEKTIAIVNGAQVQIYYVRRDVIDTFVENVCELVDTLPFNLNKYKFVFDLVNMIASTACQDTPYVVGSCDSINERFEDMLDDIHEKIGETSGGGIDVEAVLKEGVVVVETIMNDIYITMDSVVEKGLSEYDGDGLEDDEDEDEFEPYNDTDDDDASEPGGASNDNVPFPSEANGNASRSPENQQTGQNGHPDTADASVTTGEVRNVHAADAGQRGYHSEQLTTNIGEILKSQGIIGYDAGAASGDSGTGGRTSSQIEKEAEKEVLRRGNPVESQQTKAEETPKEEVKSDDLVVKVTTVGRK